jgi:hypothetical protein
LLKVKGKIVPRQIALATKLLWISLGMGLINSASQWSYLTSQASPAFVLSIQIPTLAVLAWLTYKIGRGKNWSRITYAALFAIGLIQFFPIFAETFQRSLIAGLLTTAITASQLVALYLIFVSAGRVWFASAAKSA